MKALLSIAIAASLLGVAGVSAGELPTFEVSGIPATAHQMSVLGPASGQARERLAPSGMTLAGMPVSVHQLTVLSPRRQVSRKEVADTLRKAGFSDVRFLAPPVITVMALRDGTWTTLTIDSRTGNRR